MAIRRKRSSGLMEYLTPTVSFDIFMDNYFTCFRLLIHFGVNNIRATGVLNKRKKLYSRTKTKSVLLLQPEYGFFQQNGSERGQVQDWYPNEKMVVVPVCLNDRCCSSGCVGIVLDECAT